MPYALVAGMSFSLLGLLLLSAAWNYSLLLAAAALVGVGSSVFHPESSRVARMASGGRHGLAQSVFQVGGNAGSSLGPVLAAFLCSVWAGEHAVVLARCRRGHRPRDSNRSAGTALIPAGSRERREPGGGQTVPTRAADRWSIAILAALIFSKYFYLASLSSTSRSI